MGVDEMRAKHSPPRCPLRAAARHIQGSWIQGTKPGGGQGRLGELDISHTGCGGDRGGDDDGRE